MKDKYGKFSRSLRTIARRLRKLRITVKFRVTVIILVVLFLATAIFPSTAQIVMENSRYKALPNMEDLVAQGRTFYEAERFHDAVKILQQALVTFTASGDKLRQAITLSNLSLAYQELGLWTEAKEAIAQSLKLLQNLDDSKQRAEILAQTLDVQGRWQLAHGQAEVALKTWQQAADIYKQIGDRAKVTRNRINSAQAMQILGVFRQAKNILTEVLQSLDNQPDSPLKATGLRNLGDVLRVFGNLDESRLVLKNSLRVASSLGENQEITEALLSLANTAYLQGDTHATSNFYQQAATLSVPISTRVQLLLNQFSFLLETKQWSAAAALSSKIRLEISKLPPSRMSVNARINFAQNLTKLKRNYTTETLSWEDIARLLAQAVELAQSLEDLRAESYAKGTLGWLYEQTGQFSDAQKMTEKALFIAQSINSSDIGYQWQWQLGRLLKSKGDIKQAISYYSQAIKTLQSLRSDLVTINPVIQFSFRESVEPVYRELVELLLQTEGNSEPLPENLKRARFVIESLQLAELDNFFRQACLTAKVEIDKVVEQDQTAAIIYPIILPNSLEVIVKLPGQQKLRHYTTPIAKLEVESTLSQLRENITQPHTLPMVQSLSGRVYDWLIRPEMAELSKSQVKTLVFVLDGALRNVPMASLYDGKQYLVEKYAIAISPSLQLFDPKPLPKKQLQALTAGLSEGRLGFSPLANVERELKEIQSHLGTKLLLNQQFTSQALQKQVKSLPFRVVHLATHGQFSSNPDKTFILSWDKQIKVNDLSEFLRIREENGLEPIELLVLSACQTASGDNRAALGLAGVAVRAGARSTLASLWNVDDESTAVLMSHFYRELAKTPNITKAEALRHAQLALLQNPKYQRPRFWAPYTLLGNWL
ncbi:CHAT domain-containing protein [Aetokthonos hydrillicola Thurmond2011]|jgi:CHAT domain-containing protein|uniref:CHAT domain-containing protein n=1 Tax=Aetokthonos hydrillicola Thurmond2011 TaxID=2712845 RepID=A0AAP5M900_9CYAN|nr:CHAT domain-containing protein [Aetokthonos hydrillicola]MBO3462215.1 CHAT domain-containing protein [Aetokthonos hydrillicola CCALA 1050]MBW4585087.1 CHAT domain-containing protein [Aetokthonos hydrillicola CCALA 1050]MDR9894153.1 CHAT domain-containing protein [Aetokthonos hydrillicola Thurmond2011]